MKKKIASLIAVLALSLTANSATIAWKAFTDNGLALFDGTILASNNLLRLGYFDISVATIESNSLNISFLDSHFFQLDVARVSVAPGYFGDSVDVDTRPSASTLGGKQLFIWAFASTATSSATDPASVNASINTAFQHGIFTSSLSNWLVPTDPEVGLPTESTIELSDLTSPNSSTLAATADIVIGNQSLTAPGGALNASNFGLAAVPEPSTAGFAALGLLGLLARRRR